MTAPHPLVQTPHSLVQPRDGLSTALHQVFHIAAARSSGQSQTSHVMYHYWLRWIWTADAPWFSSQVEIVHIERLTSVEEPCQRNLQKCGFGLGNVLIVPRPQVHPMKLCMLEAVQLHFYNMS